MTSEGLRRRHLLGGAAAVGAGAVAGAAGASVYAATRPEPPRPDAGEAVIRQTYSPHGVHQAGIVTRTPAVTELVAFALRPNMDAARLARLLRLWSDDIAKLMAGHPPTADPLPELAQPGVSLSVTVGLGARVFELPGLRGRRPAGLSAVPPMRHDRLQPRWNGGDLLVIVAADDPVSVATAVRRLTVDAETFATPTWVQRGSWRGTSSAGDPLTGRNLFGQVDGTANPIGPTRDKALWVTDGPEWFRGGTTLVVRRIEMDLDFWDATTRERQEKVIGRRLTDGAPITGGAETDDLDLTAQEADGALVIAADAHARRSHPTVNGGRRIVRRGLNYTHEEHDGARMTLSAGLIFLSFQADIADQFVPLQRTLDTLDALNDWTHAIGSATFAIPPGYPEGGWLASGLFT